ncbi:hypothetical protein ACWA1F_23710 [Flavobacterium sp. 3-218]
MGTYIPIDILAPHLFNFDKIEQKIREEFLKSKRLGIYWEYNGKAITISDEIGSVQGFPISTLQYVVAVFQNSKKYPSPDNAVIFNLDGTINKILKIPEFKSELILEELKKNNESNPPIESFFKGKRLCYNNYSRFVDNNGFELDILEIDYELEYTESQILDPNTLELTDFLKTRFERYDYWNKNYKP